MRLRSPAAVAISARGKFSINASEADDASLEVITRAGIDLSLSLLAPPRLQSASWPTSENHVSRVIGSRTSLPATAPVPALKAPLDLVPKTAEVTLALPAEGWRNGSVTVEMSGDGPEITLKNNRVDLR